MPFIDAIDRQFADEIRVAAYRDRVAEPRGEFTDAHHVATSFLAASLTEIARSLKELTHSETHELIPEDAEECILRRTADRLGLDPHQLLAALQAVLTKNSVQAMESLNQLLDHVN